MTHGILTDPQEYSALFGEHKEVLGSVKIFTLDDGRYGAILEQESYVLSAQDDAEYSAVGIGTEEERALDSLWSQITVPTNLLVFLEGNQKNCYYWNKDEKKFVKFNVFPFVRSGYIMFSPVVISCAKINI